MRASMLNSLQSMWASMLSKSKPAAFTQAAGRLPRFSHFLSPAWFFCLTVTMVCLRSIAAPLRLTHGHQCIGRLQFTLCHRVPVCSLLSIQPATGMHVHNSHTKCHPQLTCTQAHSHTVTHKHVHKYTPGSGCQWVAGVADAGVDPWCWPAGQLWWPGTAAGQGQSQTGTCPSANVSTMRTLVGVMHEVQRM